MLDKQGVKRIIEEWIGGREIYLVDYKINGQNRIIVTIDRKEGLAIDECVELSRYIENTLDRDLEDYELEVTSPGLDQPFKVIEQYYKNIGKEVQIILKTGEKITGILKNATPKEIEIEEVKKVRVEGRKKKEKLVLNHNYNLEEVKATKVVISFK